MQPRNPTMSRRARLTVLELGASPTAWASRHSLGTDDWVVVAQQRDEPALEFTERVRQRARRLRREDADIESVDLYASAHSDDDTAVARREVIEALGGQLAEGGRLTLWSASDDPRADAEFTDILAQFGTTLAHRQIAMNHQSLDPELSSGIRHAAPARPATDYEDDFAFDDFG